MERIISVRRLDSTSRSQILLRIEQHEIGQIGCRILGTDGDVAFEAQLSRSKLRLICAPAFDGTDNAWEDLVHRILFGRQSLKENVNVSNVEMVGQIAGSRLTLVIRRSLEGGITARLGSIQLERNDSLLETIELFDWIALATINTVHAERQLDQAREELAERSAENDRFRAQLQELVEAKQTNEQELLEKFSQLLNTKKMMIRSQQRLLAVGTEGKQRTVLEQNERIEHIQGSSRMIKRKATQLDHDVDSETAQDKKETLSQLDKSTSILSDSLSEADKPGGQKPSSPQQFLQYENAPDNSGSDDVESQEENETDDEL